MNWLRKKILRRLLRPEQLAIVSALDRPAPFKNVAPLNEDEAKNWGGMLASPLGLRVDEAMYSWINTLAQGAIMAPSEEVLAQAKFAAGCRAGWEMAKTISRMHGAEAEQTDERSDTAVEPIEQHQP